MRLAKLDHRFRTLIVAAAVAVACLVMAHDAAGAAKGIVPGPSRGAAVAGEFLLGFEPGTSEGFARTVAQSAGLVPLRWMPSLHLMLVRASAPAAESPSAALASERSVAYVEPNYVVRGDEVPDDTYYSTNQWAPQKIGAEAAWDVTHGAAGVVVAVLDSGLDMSHPEFSGKYTSGYDFVNDDSDPADDQGHGTHVSGIVAALTDNATGVASIGWNTRVMPVKVLDAYLGGTHANVAAGIEWATNHGADVVNLSLGSSLSSQALQDAVDYAYANGVLLVASAGNGATSNPYYPAAYSDVMGIAATTSTDARWSMSNYGSWISMCAPGSSVYSTSWSAGAGSGYASMSGTSQSTPHVSAVAALMLAVDGDLTNDDLQDRLEASAHDLGDAGFDIFYGYGRVDAAVAVGSCLPATATPAPTATATPTPTSPPPAAIHVGDLDGDSQPSGKNWTATVVVTVHDGSHNAVAGASVSARWSGGYSGNASCTTASNGQCSVTTGTISRNKSSVTFTMRNLSKSGYVYDEDANHDPDGDSNGTTITVYK